MTELLTATQAAFVLNVKVPRLYELVRLQIVPAVRLGRSIRFNPAALQAMIENGGVALSGGWRRLDTE